MEPAWSVKSWARGRSPTILDQAVKDEVPAVAITDTNNLFGALEFSEGAAKAGVQPIIGVELSIGYEKTEQGGRAPDPAPVLLYAQNEQAIQLASVKLLADNLAQQPDNQDIEKLL